MDKTPTARCTPLRACRVVDERLSWPQFAAAASPGEPATPQTPWLHVDGCNMNALHTRKSYGIVVVSTVAAATANRRRDLVLLCGANAQPIVNRSVLCHTQLYFS